MFKSRLKHFRRRRRSHMLWETIPKLNIGDNFLAQPDNALYTNRRVFKSTLNVTESQWSDDKTRNVNPSFLNQSKHRHVVNDSHTYLVNMFCSLFQPELRARECSNFDLFFIQVQVFVSLQNLNMPLESCRRLSVLAFSKHFLLCFTEEIKPWGWVKMTEY